MINFATAPELENFFPNSIRKSLNVISVKYQWLMNRPNRFYWSFLPGLMRRSKKEAFDPEANNQVCGAPLEFALINQPLRINLDFHKHTTTSFIEPEWLVPNRN